MGGTSTDVARYAGSLEHIFESTIAEVTIQTPQLDINTVAAGGGSILTWENGLFKVGPGSAGANPGPACYGRGGPLTVTDANFFLGRIVPDLFPRPLDFGIVKSKFEELTKAINLDKEGDIRFTPEEVAMGFISIANTTMTRPIRTLSEGRGFQTSAHNLGCFGGAGGQHAVAVARDLGIQRVIIPRYSSILSAYGMALADVVVENQEPDTVIFSQSAVPQLQSRFERLCSQGHQGLIAQGFKDHEIVHELFLNMRYQGSDTSLMIAHPGTLAGFNQAFIDRHHQEFGFTQPRPIIVEDARVRSVGKGADLKLTSPFDELRRIQSSPPVSPIQPESTTKVYFENRGWTDTGLYYLNDFPVGSRVQGPAMVVDKTQTIVVDPSSAATILPEHVILEILDVEEVEVTSNPKVVDPVQLSIFSHRFMSVAEQMGQTMQKTSISVNIKERLDFSCAVFSADGGLVANAPHIPGHLGSMSYAIAYQAKLHGPGELKPGDVLLSNHPRAGGTHLPDLTVTTPVFDDKDPTKILFFVANRGHHADIGGIQPGSMPPHSTELWQEGVAVETFKIVKEGVFDDAGLHRILVDIPGSYPGCSGTRTLKDNIADLQAAIAANNRGIQLITALVNEYSWPVVEFYMEAIQNNAAQAVRQLLRTFARKFAGQDLQATDYLDDGTPLSLKITIDEDSGDATFDFEGTGHEHYGNLNCPPAVMFSGIMVRISSLAISISVLTTCSTASDQ